MDNKILLRNLIAVLLLVVIFVMILFSLNDFALRLNGETENHIGTYLSETAVQSATLFNTEIKGTINTLNILGAYISTFADISDPEIKKVLDMATRNSNFTSMGIAYASGNAEFTNAGKTVDVSDSEFYKKASRGEIAVFENVKSLIEGTDILIVAIPVFQEGSVKAVLCAVYDLNELENLLDITTFGGEGYTYIVDVHGNMILKSGDKGLLGRGENIFDYYTDFDGDDVDDVDKAKKSMLTNSPGFGHLERNGEERYVSYAPTDYNGWMVFSVIPKSIVASQTESVSSLALELTIKIIVLFLIFMLYIMIWQRINNKELIKSHSETLMNEKRYKIVLEQANDVIFEWDAAGKSDYFSSKWFDYFDEAPTYEEIKANVETPKKFINIHPKDAKSFTAFLQSQVSAEPQKEAEFRIKNKNGKYIWMRVRATAIHNDRGGLESVIGTLADITEEYEERRRLIKKSQTDSLTGFYNKKSSENLIDNYCELAADNFSAFMLIDFDDFKLINDTGGHPYGDKILTLVAKGMKTLFRKSDILMRIGGDEFAVFLKNIENKKDATDKAGEVLELFHKIDKLENGEARVSCSIGLSFFPKDGSKYMELYEAADTAMYTAKLNGKDRYVLYDSSQKKA